MKTLHNIFSTKKEIIREDLPKPKIIIDYREKQSLVAAELVKLGFEIEFKELKVADYIVNDVAIERKTVSDFISSMLNKRLIKQLEELQQYPNKLLIIEGIDEQELYRMEDNMRFPSSGHKEIAYWNRKGSLQKKPLRCLLNPNAVRGFLLSILLKHNIPLLFTQNYKDTAQFIYRIAMKKNQEMGIRANKKSLNKKEQMQFILEGFPGIGPKNAKKLLRKFSTLQNIFSAPQDELQKIIGKKAEIFLLTELQY